MWDSETDFQWKAIFLHINVTNVIEREYNFFVFYGNGVMGFGTVLIGSTNELIS